MRPLHSVIVLTLALLLDRLGEPPTYLHPVGFIGRLISRLERSAPVGARAQLVYGLGLVLVPTVAAALFNALLDGVAKRLPSPIGLLLRALALTWTFSLAGLERAAQQVRHHLEFGELQAARLALHSLVSRSTAQLTSGEVAAAAVESVAENSSDSVVAPLFWWAIGGLPAAAAYRAINTADAMVGYHGRYELLGRAAARLDDLVNLAPARMTALGTCLVSGQRQAFQTVARHRARTESPNAGWPMSAMAGALGVRLTKPGHYVLGDEFPEPTPADIDRAMLLARRATALCVFTLVLTVRQRS